MGLARSTSKSIALLALLAFVCIRLGDAHLHMCLDGAESPVTIHTADASVHNDADHEDGSHQDVDVKPFAAAVFKALSDTDAVIVAFVIALVTIDQVCTTCSIPSAALPILKPPSAWLPPSRGPPR